MRGVGWGWSHICCSCGWSEKALCLRMDNSKGRLASHHPPGVLPEDSLRCILDLFQSGQAGCRCPISPQVASWRLLAPTRRECVWRQQNVTCGHLSHCHGRRSSQSLGTDYIGEESSGADRWGKDGGQNRFPDKIFKAAYLNLSWLTSRYIHSIHWW